MVVSFAEDEALSGPISSLLTSVLGEEGPNLAAANWTGNVVELGLRLRALAELSRSLDTEQLIRLACLVETCGERLAELLLRGGLDRSDGPLAASAEARPWVRPADG